MKMFEEGLNQIDFNTMNLLVGELVSRYNSNISALIDTLLK